MAPVPLLPEPPLASSQRAIGQDVLVRPTAIRERLESSLVGVSPPMLFGGVSLAVASGAGGIVTATAAVTFAAAAMAASSLNSAACARQPSRAQRPSVPAKYKNVCEGDVSFTAGCMARDWLRRARAARAEAATASPEVSTAAPGRDPAAVGTIRRMAPTHLHSEDSSGEASSTVGRKRPSSVTSRKVSRRVAGTASATTLHPRHPLCITLPTTPEGDGASSHVCAQLARDELEPWGFTWHNGALTQGRLVIASVCADSPAGRWDAQQRSRGLGSLGPGCELVAANGAMGRHALQRMLASAATQIYFDFVVVAPRGADCVEPFSATNSAKVLAARRAASHGDGSGRNKWKGSCFTYRVRNSFIEVSEAESSDGGCIAACSRLMADERTVTVSERRSRHNSGSARRRALSDPGARRERADDEAALALEGDASPSDTDVASVVGENWHWATEDEDPAPAAHSAPTPAGYTEAVVVGLVQAPHFNGCRCLVDSYDYEAHRFVVRILDGASSAPPATAKLRGENLLVRGKALAGQAAPALPAEGSCNNALGLDSLESFFAAPGCWYGEVLPSPWHPDVAADVPPCLGTGDLVLCGIPLGEGGCCGGPVGLYAEAGVASDGAPLGVDAWPCEAPQWCMGSCPGSPPLGVVPESAPCTMWWPEEASPQLELAADWAPWAESAHGHLLGCNSSLQHPVQHAVGHAVVSEAPISSWCVQLPYDEREADAQLHTAALAAAPLAAVQREVGAEAAELTAAEMASSADAAGSAPPCVLPEAVPCASTHSIGMWWPNEAPPQPEAFAEWASWVEPARSQLAGCHPLPPHPDRRTVDVQLHAAAPAPESLDVQIQHQPDSIATAKKPLPTADEAIAEEATPEEPARLAGAAALAGTKLFGDEPPGAQTTVAPSRTASAPAKAAVEDATAVVDEATEPPDKERTAFPDIASTDAGEAADGEGAGVSVAPHAADATAMTEATAVAGVAAAGACSDDCVAAGTETAGLGVLVQTSTACQVAIAGAGAAAKAAAPTATAPVDVAAEAAAAEAATETAAVAAEDVSAQAAAPARQPKNQIYSTWRPSLRPCAMGPAPDVVARRATRAAAAAATANKPQPLGGTRAEAAAGQQRAGPSVVAPPSADEAFEDYTPSVSSVTLPTLAARHGTSAPSLGAGSAHVVASPGQSQALVLATAAAPSGPSLATSLAPPLPPAVAMSRREQASAPLEAQRICGREVGVGTSPCSERATHQLALVLGSEAPEAPRPEGAHSPPRPAGLLPRPRTAWQPSLRLGAPSLEGKVSSEPAGGGAWRSRAATGAASDSASTTGGTSGGTQNDAQAATAGTQRGTGSDEAFAAVVSPTGFSCTWSGSGGRARRSTGGDGPGAAWATAPARADAATGAARSRACHGPSRRHSGHWGAGN